MRKTRALVHVMNRVSDLTNTRSGNGGNSSITSSCKGIVSKTPPPCLPPPTDIVPGPPPGQASPIMSSLSPQDLPWLPPYVPQATPHPPSPEGNPRVPLTPQKGVLRKPNRIKSNQEIRTSKPPSRKLSRENVSRRRKSNHDLSAFAKDVATMVESDVVALEGIVRRTTTEQVKGIHEAHTRIVNETLTSMHHSMSRSEIKTTHTRRFNSRNENGSTGLFDIPELRMSF